MVVIPAALISTIPYSTLKYIERHQLASEFVVLCHHSKGEIQSPVVEKAVNLIYQQITKGNNLDCSLVFEITADNDVTIYYRGFDTDRLSKDVIQPIPNLASLHIPKSFYFETENLFKSRIYTNQGIYPMLSNSLEASGEMALASIFRELLQSSGYSWVGNTNGVYRPGATIYANTHTTVAFDASGMLCWATAKARDNLGRVVAEISTTRQTDNRTIGLFKTFGYKTTDRAEDETELLSLNCIFSAE